MSDLAGALYDSLLRLLPPPADSRQRTLLLELIQALSSALERGELGLDLNAEPPEEVEAAHWPAQHLRALQASGWLVDSSALPPPLEQPGTPQLLSEAPIVQDGPWLRWRRWHEQLQHCLEALLQRAAQPLEQAASSEQISAACAAAASAGLDRDQQAAVAALQQHRLVLLLGGPGTGKTSTVAQMLTAAQQLQPQLRLHLAAPTGKAAARLAAAINRPELPCTTLHRLLEAQGEGRFRRNARQPLDLDLVVVDEVSMVDLPLMRALLEALPDQARLLLVGDAGQLPPVGPGAVLEELCRPQRRQRLGAAVVELRTTYRNNGAIAAMAEVLRQQPAGSSLLERLLPELRQLDRSANLRWRQASLQQLPDTLLRPLRQHQQNLTALAQQLRWDGELADAADSEALLRELERLIALSPLRQGPWGVEAVHRALLGPLAGAPLQRWPLGTPVLNRLNRPEQGLANGDIGVLVERNDGERLVLMAGQRLLHPARLGGAEPALALTVHKAQGSQYGTVLLLLPPSRQRDPRLLYTGLTRARNHALLVTPAEAT